MERIKAESFTYALYRWNVFHKQWVHMGYLASTPKEYLVVNSVKGLLSGPDKGYVAVLHQPANRYEYYVGQNGQIEPYMPLKRG
jgi:hypothetical protein